ncbi:MAG TPA: TonB-dependent receptor [Gammaproteobacteria bacterium]
MSTIRRFLPPSVHPLRAATPLAAAVAAALGTAGAPAAAQEQAGQSGLEEIVVTARFREENIQTTPISISAFSGEDLEVRSLENVEDIGLAIPNAYFRKNASNYGPNNTVGLRGLNQVDFSYSFEPTVGLYIDDVYHSTITGSDMDLIDLERVEVLRGPQGTLFGKNSIGGAIRLISRKPQGDNSGTVQVTFGDYDRLDLKAVGDLALIEDKLFARVVGVTREREGFGATLDFTCEMIRRGTPELAGIGDGIGGVTVVGQTDVQLGPGVYNIPIYAPVMVTPGSPEDNAFSLPAARNIAQDGSCETGKLGGQSSEAGRVMLRYLPTDRLEINFSADVQNSVDDPNVDAQLTRAGSPLLDGRQSGQNATDNNYSNGPVFAHYGIGYTWDDRFVSPTPYTNYATFSDIISGQTYPRDSVLETRGFSLVFDYALSDNVNAKLILADRSYDSEWTNDSDRTPFALVQTHYIQNHDQQQAELQITGTFGAQERVGWTTGLFYFTSDSRAYNTTEFEGFAYSNSLQNFTANDLYGTDNKSLFVHFTYDITERLGVSGGARYTDESKTHTFNHFPVFPRRDIEFGDSRVDWKASVDFSLTDDIFLYAQAATGFTSESATPRVFTIGQLRSLPGEEVVSYEIGSKLDLLDNRLRLNAAVFTSDYDPRVRQSGGVSQCDAPDDLDPFPYRLAGGVCPPGTFFAGGGGLPWFWYDNSPGTLSGYEIELTASPTDAILVNFSLGQNEYENDETNPASPNYIAPGYLFQPEYNASLGFQYTVQLGNGGTLIPRIDGFYQSERHNGSASAPPNLHGIVANVCPQQCVPAYTIYNARLTYVPPDSSWRLSLSGTNVTDKFYWQQLGPEITVSNATGAVTPTLGRSGVAGRPREWALTIEKDF